MATSSFVLVLGLAFSLASSGEGLRLNRKGLDDGAVEFSADAEVQVRQTKQELFTLISNGTCNQWGYQAIGTSNECSDAAKHLGLRDREARNANNLFTPPGCYYRRESTNKLWFNSDGTHHPLASPVRRVICRFASCIELEEVKESLQLLKSHKSHEEREQAARMLNDIGCSETAPALITALQTDKLSEVRYWAAEALGDMSGEEVLPALIAASREDLDTYVSQSAIDSLGKRRNRKALPALVAIALRDKDNFLRSHARDALKQIRSAEVAQPLLAVLEDDERKDSWTRHHNRWTRLHTVEALGAIALDRRKPKAGKKLVPTFIKVLVNDKHEQVRGESASVLGSLCDASPQDRLCTQAVVALKAAVDECPGFERFHNREAGDDDEDGERFSERSAWVDQLGQDKVQMCTTAFNAVDYIINGREEDCDNC